MEHRVSEIILKDPGMVGNDKDDMSCLHACIQMVMKTRTNGTVFSFDEINKIFRSKPGYYSWGYAIAETLSRNGFSVKSILAFSTKRFVEEKEAYLLEWHGEEVGRVQIKNTDMPIVLEDAQKFLKANNIDIIERVPTSDDVRNLLADGWYLIPLVNAKRLNLQPGYAGHFIFVYGFDDDTVLFHDPGLPPIAARRVPWALFESAWASPSEKAKVLSCYKPVD